jgi:hypothetical protein
MEKESGVKTSLFSKLKRLLLTSLEILQTKTHLCVNGTYHTPGFDHKLRHQTCILCGEVLREGGLQGHTLIAAYHYPLHSLMGR